MREYHSGEAKSDSIKGLLEPAKLSEEQWNLLEAAVQGSKYAVTIAKLRRVGNVPQAAEEILPEDEINQGNSILGDMFRLKKIPFRLARIGGNLTRKEILRGARPRRPLAIVEWPPMGDVDVAGEPEE